MMYNIDKDWIVLQLNGNTLNIIAGTVNDDYLIGTEDDDEIFGLGGNDNIFSYGGDDRLYGGMGDDLLFAESGNNYLFGGEGNDRLYGGINNDMLFGGSGDDIIIDYGGKNFIDAGDQNDLIYAFGFNTIQGGAGDDRIYNIGGGTIEDSAGNDHYTLLGDENTNLKDLVGDNTVDLDNSGINSVVLGNGNDTININQGFNIVQTFDGNDVVTIKGGDNLVVFGQGNNQAFIENGNNEIAYGGGSHDEYSALSGFNFYLVRVHLTSGNSISITGGVGDDTLEITMIEPQQLWYKTAINDYFHFLESSPDANEIFDFSSYDPNGLLFNITASGIEHIIATGIFNNRMTPQQIELSNNTIAEDSLTDTLIGKVSSVNDPLEVPTYSLIDDVDGLFRIDESSGELFLAKESVLDLDLQPNYSLQVRVDDGVNLWTIKEFNIEVGEAIAPLENVETLAWSEIFGSTESTLPNAVNDSSESIPQITNDSLLSNNLSPMDTPFVDVM